MDVGVKMYQALGRCARKDERKNAVNLGDEGGFAPNFKNDVEPFQILKSVAKKLHLENKVDFGMDAAATDIKKIERQKIGGNLYQARAGL